MVKYYFPRGMRLSTLEERLRFYKEEFDVEKVVEWLSERMDKVRFAVITGRHSGIYPEEYAEGASTTIIIDEYCDVEDVKSQIVILFLLLLFAPCSVSLFYLQKLPLLSVNKKICCSPNLCKIL